MPYLVGTKGQVVIDKRIRDRLGVKAGWRATQEVVGDHVEIRFLPPDHEESLAGCLAGYVEHRGSGALGPAAERETAWRAMAAEAGRKLVRREKLGP